MFLRSPSRAAVLVRTWPPRRRSRNWGGGRHARRPHVNSSSVAANRNDSSSPTAANDIDASPFSAAAYGIDNYSSAMAFGTHISSSEAANGIDYSAAATASGIDDTSFSVAAYDIDKSSSATACGVDNSLSEVANVIDNSAPATAHGIGSAFFSTADQGYDRFCFSASAHGIGNSSSLLRLMALIVLLSQLRLFLSTALLTSPWSFSSLRCCTWLRSRPSSKLWQKH